MCSDSWLKRCRQAYPSLLEAQTRQSPDAHQPSPTLDLRRGAGSRWTAQQALPFVKKGEIASWGLMQGRSRPLQKRHLVLESVVVQQARTVLVEVATDRTAAEIHLVGATAVELLATVGETAAAGQA
jgi:hypothetical protein